MVHACIRNNYLSSLPHIGSLSTVAKEWLWLVAWDMDNSFALPCTAPGATPADGILSTPLLA